MKYLGLVESGATVTEKQEQLAGGDMTTITIRIPRNVKVAAARRLSLGG